MSNFEGSAAQLLIDTRKTIGGQEQEGDFYPGVAHLEAMHDAYRLGFSAAGYGEEPPVSVACGTDPTVRFIGSHISVLKPYVLERTIPEGGVVMVQQCLRTHNVRTLLDDDVMPKYGSSFTSLGGVAASQQLEQVCDDVFTFLGDGLGLDTDEIRIKASAQDKDLIEACRTHLPDANIEYDSEDPKYYTHQIGIEGVSGRNFNIALPSPLGRTYQDIGNIIVLESPSETLGVEIALGDSTILKQLYGLGHILDAYAIELPHDKINGPLLRKMEDAMMTCLILYGEGLRPSASSNQSRILRSYTKALTYYRRQAKITFDELEKYLIQVEEGCLRGCGSAADIMAFVEAYDGQINLEQRNPCKEDEKIRCNLSKLGLL